VQQRKIKKFAEHLFFIQFSFKAEFNQTHEDYKPIRAGK